MLEYYKIRLATYAEDLMKCLSPDPRFTNPLRKTPEARLDENLTRDLQSMKELCNRYLNSSEKDLNVREQLVLESHCIRKSAAFKELAIQGSTQLRKGVERYSFPCEAANRL